MRGSSSPRAWSCQSGGTPWAEDISARITPLSTVTGQHAGTALPSTRQGSHRGTHGRATQWRDSIVHDDSWRRGLDGAWYVSQLVGFPFEQGSSTIWRLVPGHAPTAWATGLTNVTSLAFADDGTLYAVELASNGLLSGPIGALVEVIPGADSHDVVAGGLFAPYGVAIRGGSAYVTTGSVLPGGAAVVRIAL
ncbi:ScyD/ScyE family protein [Intrasporangium sp.]|uniref:ScyD/ScyE family protein n=1 Tax=Intrasporangium sp. TaxID=1925024 RepID=UPI00293BFD7B|nr:ScyD/ScyE family protein [Intrasporangium sp.]